MTASQILKEYSNGERKFSDIILSPENNLKKASFRVTLQGANLKKAIFIGADLQKSNLTRANLEEAILIDANLQGVDFQSAQLQKANFQRANLKKAIFTGVTFPKAILQGAILINAKLQRAILEEANLEEAILIKAILIDAKLQKSNLTRANLEEAILIDANLEEAILQGAILINAKLQKSNLQKANLEEANLEEAILIDANLEEANLEEAILIKANLRANLTRANFTRANLQGAILINAKLQKANLEEAIFIDANLQKANLEEAIFINAKLQKANLQGANLQGANLQGANLQGANLQSANLQGANLREAILIDAKLQEANLQDAILREAKLQGANLQGAKLQKANLQKTEYREAIFEKALFDEKTKFPSGFNLRKRGMLKVQPSQPHSSKVNNPSNTHNNQSSVVTSNNELLEIPISNFKPLEDFQENLQAEIKEPVSETNDPTVPEAFDLNKQEVLETETAQVNSQIDDLSNAIVDQKFNQEIIQNISVDNQSEASQNLTEPESIPTQISTEQSVSSLSPSNIEPENHEPVHQQEAQSDSEEICELNEEKKQLEIEGFYIVKSEQDARQKIRVSILARQGQPQFRQALLKAYNSRCAITGCDAELALEAAHIIPYREQENNHPSNGLLLRADIHTLFDLNLIAIHPETMTIHLAPSLRETSYKELHGKKLRQPKDPAESPKREALQWRYQQCEWMQR